ELGQALDPSNSLYRPGGHPAQVPAAGGGGRAEDLGSVPTQVVPTAVTPTGPGDLDLDLDFSIGDDEPAPPPVRASAAALPGAAVDLPPVVEPMPSLDMDFGSAVQPPAAAEPATARAEPAGPDGPDLDVSDKGLSFDATQTMKAAPVKAAPAPAPDAGMIEFDLGALSLDLDSPPAAVAPATPAAPAAVAPAAPTASKAPAEEAFDSTAGAPHSTGGLGAEDNSDPLATKLALAQEFNAIGDPDGARSLAEEVLAEASGDLKQKAQRFLAEIA
ncbi:MAG TPA: FimV/HubP family polar landmark protein, partial [Novosphingobium sp.]|nr:FimV/HubP family polar landmark protein [Novosphingobium sp.]